MVEILDREPSALGLDWSPVDYIVRKGCLQELSDSHPGGILKPMRVIIAPEFNHSTALEMQMQVK